MNTVIDDLNRIEKDLAKRELYGASQTMICAAAEIVRLRRLVRAAFLEGLKTHVDESLAHLDQWDVSDACKKLGAAK